MTKDIFPTTLSDRMKLYEGREAKRTVMPRLPLIVRLDGKNFSKLTRNLTKPFDADFSNVMISTTMAMAKETNANCAYTQSDEISLVYWSDEPNTELPFCGRLQKIQSIFAAQCTLFFNQQLETYFNNLLKSNPVFDCRAWAVPSEGEAANVLIWREQDATRNSIMMAGQSEYSHSVLNGKNVKQVQAMLLEKDINWNNYPVCFKRGTYIQRKQNPDKEDRKIHTVVDMPILSSVVNRADVVLRGADPILKQEENDSEAPPA